MKTCKIINDLQNSYAKEERKERPPSIQAERKGQRPAFKEGKKTMEKRTFLSSPVQKKRVRRNSRKKEKLRFTEGKSP